MDSVFDFSKIDESKYALPLRDGSINDYVHPEAESRKEYFDRNRRVVFINGMANSPSDHAEGALALSFVQMCKVVGIYNLSVSGWRDFLQCIGDKNQFNGPISLSSNNSVMVRGLIGGVTSAEAARGALARNPAQVSVFDFLRQPGNRGLEIFAHSQGNLILSNALQAIFAVDGAAGIGGYTVHTFGSPSVTWPLGITKYEHGFTFDPVSWLAGFDTTWSISKVGMPRDSHNPITHAFLEYLKVDPAFVVNRYRTGSWGMTFNMDERGLAKSLAAMGTNLDRVFDIFTHLKRNHSSDSDDVAVLYVEAVRTRPGVTGALSSHHKLRKLLIEILEGGITFADEQRAIDYLEGL